MKKPLPPVAPEKPSQFKKQSRSEILYDRSCSLKDLVDKAKGADLSTVYLNMHEDYYICLKWNVEDVVNPNYDKELANYNERYEAYTEKLETYKKELKAWVEYQKEELDKTLKDQGIV
jgi:hypothetical protein